MDPVLLAANKNPIRYIAGVAVAQALYLIAMMTLVFSQPSYSNGFAILATASCMGVAASYCIHRPIFDEADGFTSPRASIRFLLGIATLLVLLAFLLIAPFRLEPEKMHRALWLFAMVFCASIAFALSVTLAPLVAYWKSRQRRRGSSTAK